jgi:hypothetical protein
MARAVCLSIDGIKVESSDSQHADWIERALVNRAKRLLSLTVLACVSFGAHAQDPNADIYGNWKIKDTIGMGAVASLSEHQARQLIGKTLLISPEKFEFNGQVCSYPHYQRSKENPTRHFDREWRTRVEGIPFPNPVTIIETAGCDYLYLIRKDHLMIAEGGIFFEAVRAGTVSRKARSGHR